MSEMSSGVVWSGVSSWHMLRTPTTRLVSSARPLPADWWSPGWSSSLPPPGRLNCWCSLQPEQVCYDWLPSPATAGSFLVLGPPNKINKQTEPAAGATNNNRDNHQHLSRGHTDTDQVQHRPVLWGQGVRGWSTFASLHTSLSSSSLNGRSLTLL